MSLKTRHSPLIAISPRKRASALRYILPRQVPNGSSKSPHRHESFTTALRIIQPHTDNALQTLWARLALTRGHNSHTHHPRVRTSNRQAFMKHPEACRRRLFRNGCQSRLHSVYDKKAQKYIYRHDRDRGKSIQMTFRQGRLESLEDILSGDFIYIRGVTHKAQN